MADSRNSAGNRLQTPHAQLERRMLVFAAHTIKMTRSHGDLPSSMVFQLTRSVTSIGANYTEACNASPKLDFRNKIYIAKKEAAETRYWLELCNEVSPNSTWVELRSQAQEFLLILQAITNSLRSKSAT